MKPPENHGNTNLNWLAVSTTLRLFGNFGHPWVDMWKSCSVCLFFVGFGFLEFFGVESDESFLTLHT